MGRAHDVLRYEGHPLDSMLQPRTIAVIGATEKAGSVGRSVLWNLVTSPFGGTVYPVNHRHRSVLGIRAYPSIAQLPEPIDLAVIVTPATSVPAVITECLEAGVKGAIIISAGFKEIGPAGAELERQIREQARGRMRIIGPNCLGVMRPVTGLNATFANAMARPGNVGFISQSGALCCAILDWSLRENFGFSAFISVGSMLDVGWGDLIDYLGDDPQTTSIVIYMESIGDARAFLSAAREVALSKPIILIKAGRSAAAAKAAASHTGALVGSDQVLDAACRRVGVLRVNGIEDLFLMSEVLAKQPRPRGPRLTIITNAGGPGVLATDALIRGGGELAELSPETLSALNSFLPGAWSRGNPIDILGDADAERYVQTVRAAAADPQSDGLLVVLTPQAMTDPTRTADGLKACARIEGKPVLASWMGGAEVEAGRAILAQAGIPTFPYSDTAARLFTYMWQYSYNLRGIYETPVLADDPSESLDRSPARRLIDAARSEGRTLLTEPESKDLLSAYQIPTVATHIARSPDEAVGRATQIGYPVVLKVYSKTITHKTDVGGVLLNLRDTAAVRQGFATIKQAVTDTAGADGFEGVTVQPMVRLEGYELILGSSIDPQFGPVLLFGAGGQLVEVFQDRALALPPLTTTLARRMMEQTRIYQALKGVRGRKAVDLAALEGLLVRFSRLVAEQRWIKEIDINPLLAGPDGFIALDARVVLHDLAISEADLPRTSIRPYPVQYVSTWTSPKGLKVTIRPIRPEDEPLVVKFHETLSERSVYQRFFNMIPLSTRVMHDRLRRRCFIDFDREIALVIEHRDPRAPTSGGGGGGGTGGEPAILGIGRLSKRPGPQGSNEAEFAAIISDQYQGQGLGTRLMRQLVEVGKAEGMSKITADILPTNLVMQRVCEKIGYRLHRDEAQEMVVAEMELAGK